MNDQPARADKTVEGDTSHIPYVTPLPPPSPTPHQGLPTISTLPPIATARPQRTPHHHQQQHYRQGNIPIVNGVRQPAPNPAATATSTLPQYAPTVVNLSAHASVPPHGPPLNSEMPPPMQTQPPPPPFFEYMDKCRYAAGFMLCYYVCTFLFLQPFFLGVLGIVTGFLGYYGARPPIFAAHIKWIRGYLWMNMSLLVMNIWYAAILLFFFSTASRRHDDDANDGTDGNANANVGGGDSGSAYYRYDEQHLGIFIGLVIGLNMVLHVRGVRTARCFYAEMQRAGPLPGQRTAIVLA